MERIFKPANERINIKQIINHPYVKCGPRFKIKDKMEISPVQDHDDGQTNEILNAERSMKSINLSKIECKDKEFVENIESIKQNMEKKDGETS